MKETIDEVKIIPTQDEIIEELVTLICGSVYLPYLKVAMLRYVFGKEQPRVVIPDNHPQFTPISQNEAQAYRDGRREGIFAIKDGVSRMTYKNDKTANPILYNVIELCDSELIKCYGSKEK